MKRARSDLSVVVFIASLIFLGMGALWFLRNPSVAVSGRTPAWISVRTTDQNSITTLLGWGEVNEKPFSFRWRSFPKIDASKVTIEANLDGTYDVLVSDKRVIRCMGGVDSEISEDKVLWTGKVEVH